MSATFESVGDDVEHAFGGEQGTSGRQQAACSCPRATAKLCADPADALRVASIIWQIQCFISFEPQASITAQRWSKSPRTARCAMCGGAAGNKVQAFAVH